MGVSLERKVTVSPYKVLFIGHNERRGNALNYGADYCEWCHAEWPQGKVTLPYLLNVMYCWLVERNWKWFERMDMWLCLNHGKFLPHWWEY